MISSSILKLNICSHFVSLHYCEMRATHKMNNGQTLHPGLWSIKKQSHFLLLTSANYLNMTHTVSRRILFVS